MFVSKPEMVATRSPVSIPLYQLMSVPKTRMDLFEIMFKFSMYPARQLYYGLLLKVGSPTASIKGFYFETIVITLQLMKCFPQIPYDRVMRGRIGAFVPVQSIRELLDEPISQGDNPADMIIQHGETTVAFSCKFYTDDISVSDTDIILLKRELIHKGFLEPKIALFVRDRNNIRKLKHNDSYLASCFAQIQKDGLLLDDSDVITAISMFQRTYCSPRPGVCIRYLPELVEKIDTDCLGITRKRLFVKMHQEMTVKKFIRRLSQKPDFDWCIAHKMRSGKSITILLICKHLLENTGAKRILVMTSVPATLKSFENDMNDFIEFKNINFKKQDDFAEIDNTFSGIVFCSTQYLKIDGKNTDKKQILKKYNFDAIFNDEGQLGGATEKTQKNIMNADRESSTDDIVNEIKKNIRIRVLVSGTPDSTCRALGIYEKSIWDLVDENAMKRIMSSVVSKQEKDEFMRFMAKRHGPLFDECFYDKTLDRDYSKCPTQVLIRHTVSPKFAKMIEEHNRENNTNLGYNLSELFSLSQASFAPDNENPDNRKVHYIEQFAICKTNNGVKVLKGVLNSIISNDMNDTSSIMHHIETTQSQYGSRISTEENPLLFLVFLPTHTGNGNIHMIQNTLKKFIKDNHLWSNYHVASSSAQDTHGGSTYMDFVEGLMIETKRLKKSGCVLLLGNQGTVGITYKDCDATIHMDSGMNLDSQKQRMARALTDAAGKTIGINVDMNIQRTYTIVLDMIHTFRQANNTFQTYPEILQYMLKHNIFLFNPHEINFGNIRSDEIHTYYKQQIDEVMKSGVVDDSVLLDQILCEDSFRTIIREYQHSRVIYNNVINPLVNGLHEEVPTANPDKIQQDSYIVPSKPETPQPTTGQSPEQIPPEKMEEIINITFEICRTFLFPLLSIISRVFEIQTFSNIFTNPKTKLLLINLLRDKKIDLDEETYPIFIDAVNTIITSNMEIVNNIREIYRTNDPLRYRELIAKHFIPTETERKGNAEVPTPVQLVNDMLDKMPTEFWKTPKKVFEPCCGKGNFVLGIFDKFWKGLAESIPSEIDRSRVIMTECIYYADLTALNVFITTEIVKCHVQSYCGLTVLDYEFNTYVGDTLTFNTETYWRVPIEQFATIGNPPYSTDPSKPDTKPLYDKFILKYIACRFLLFVVPSRWFIGGKGLDYFREFMMKRTDIAFIQHVDDADAWFGKNSVEIKGGVNYFLKDSNYNGECLFNGVLYNLSKYDRIIKPKYHRMIDAVIHMESINQTYCSSGYFKYRTNDSRLKNTGKIKCYVSLQKSKDRCKYIDVYTFNETNTFWKVITARAAYGAFSGFSEKFIGRPDEIYTDSYISFRVNSEEEAKSLLSYFETKFANYMLSIRKISQDISENTCKWIPLLPLDRIWTDDKVCEYFNIDKSLYM